MNDHILQNAWRLHQAGNFAEAARLYNEVLRMNPRHLGALQMLGFLHFQRGEFAEAERIKVGVSPMTGEELQKLIADVSNLSPALLEKVRAAYTTTKMN